MLEKAWRKENSLKPVKIWLLLRKITKKSAWTLWREKAKKEKNTKNFGSKSIAIFSEALDFRFFHFYFNRNHSVTFSFVLTPFFTIELLNDHIGQKYYLPRYYLSIKKPIRPFLFL